MLISDSLGNIDEGIYVRWLFTDNSIAHLKVSLDVLNKELKENHISKEFHEHYSFMFELRIKKLKLLQTLNK